MGGIDHAAIVRAWPDLLDWLSRHKRVTWTLVSASTQPLSFDGSRLVLAIETAGLAETFRRGAHPAFVQVALMELLGVDAWVEGVVAADARDAGRDGGAREAAITTPAAVSEPTDPTPEPGPTAPTAAPGAVPPPSAQPASTTTAGPGTSAGPSARPAVTPVGRPPGSSTSSARPQPVSAQPDWSSAPPPSASAPSWATDGDDPIERAPSRPRQPVSAVPEVTAVGRVAPSPPAPARPAEVVDDPESISDDDEDIEASGEVGQAVVERLLGGTVISEEDH